MTEKKKNNPFAAYGKAITAVLQMFSITLLFYFLGKKGDLYFFDQQGHLTTIGLVIGSVLGMFFLIRKLNSNE